MTLNTHVIQEKNVQVDSFMKNNNWVLSRNELKNIIMLYCLQVLNTAKDPLKKEKVELEKTEKCKKDDQR